MVSRAGMENRQQVLGFLFEELAKRWEKSPFTVRRLADNGLLRTIAIGGTRYVPFEEVKRAETEGAGNPRKRKHQSAESKVSSGSVDGLSGVRG